MSNVKHISYYTNVMQQWSKAFGPKPTEAELAIAHVHGRPGKQSLIVAMALRPDGVTRAQMLGASGAYDGKPTPQLNHMRALVDGKMLTRLPVPGAYVCEPGPKHAQYAELHGARAAEKVEAAKPAKPAKKAAGKRKAKQASAAPAVAETPASEAPVAVEAMPVAEPAQPTA